MQSAPEPKLGSSVYFGEIFRGFRFLSSGLPGGFRFCTGMQPEVELPCSLLHTTALLYSTTLRLYDIPDQTVMPDCTGGSAVRHISGKKQERIFAEHLHVEVPDAPSMHLVGHVARVLAKQMSRLLQGSVLTMAQALKLGLSPMRFLVPKMVRVYDLL